MLSFAQDKTPTDADNAGINWCGPAISAVIFHIFTGHKRNPCLALTEPLNSTESQLKTTIYAKAICLENSSNIT